MDISEAETNIGRWVVYNPGYGPSEDGHIQRVTSAGVMVKYVTNGRILCTPANSLTFGSNTKYNHGH